MGSQKENNDVEILVVEDSRTQAEKLSHLLTEHGFQVRVAANGKEALAAAQERRPTIIVSDIVMPEMDGYTLCKKIKSEAGLKDIPVILLTSLSRLPDVVKGIECGADNFVKKPYNEKSLLGCIEYLLLNRKLRTEPRTEFGVEIYLAGQKHYVTSDRRQILDLLISTYDEAVRMNEDLEGRQRELARSYHLLDVLYRMAASLNASAGVEEIASRAIRHALEFPGVQAGWIFLRDGDGRSHSVCAGGLPAAVEDGCAMENDCPCLSKLASGELPQAMNIVECDWLRKKQDDNPGLRCHAAVPLRSGDRAFGVMNLAGTDQRLFSDAELRILTGVGDQVAVALERGELLEQLERKVQERTAALSAEITERKQLEAQLLQSQKMEAVGRLAGGIAHDFNNLLTVIKGYSELLVEEVGGDGRLRRAAEEIDKAADRAALLTRQLLAFSRRQVLEPEVLDLNDVVANMDKMLRRLIGEDIDLVSVRRPGLGRVKADPGQIEQVIMNLAVNARDAMPQGGKLTLETANVELDEVYARNHVAITPGSYVMLAVSDTGCGMDAETQARIFEPFFTTKELGKGTGLGLATVYGIVKQSGGYIWVYSEPGQGTTFKVYLPRLEEAVETAQPEREIVRPARGSETVLLVEDEENVRQLVRQTLEKNGYTVLEARAGAEATQLSAQHPGPIHLMLTDVVMPKMSGRELAERLALLRPGIKVLYMSGYTDNAIVHHGVLDPGTAFLQKPFTAADLGQKVREVLDSP